MKGEQPDQQDQSILRNLEEPDRGHSPRGCEVGRVRKIGLPEIDEFERGQFRRSAGICLDPVERFGLQAVGIADLAKEIGKHTSELQSLMRISYAVFCLKKKKRKPHK